MTYLNFLVLFVILPTALMIVLFRKSLARRHIGIIGVVAVVAVLWTTPWDNYLVANGVWWYNPDLVLGLRLWYVPVEEYSFFVLQTMMTGVLLAGLSARFGARLQVRSRVVLPPTARLVPGLCVLVIAALMLGIGDPHLNYAILILGWLGFVPLMIQWSFGLDILLQRWRLMLVAIALPTAWLTLMDAIAIGAGTWTIDADQTVGIMLPGGVPLEEGLFFALTNVLIVQGIILLSAPESQIRLARWLERRWPRLLPVLRRFELSEG